LAGFFDEVEVAWLGVDLREEEVEVEPDGADESKSSAVDAFAFRSERAVVVVSEYACSAPTVCVDIRGRARGSVTQKRDPGAGDREVD
jgi:hypothetical protein